MVERLLWEQDAAGPIPVISTSANAFAATIAEGFADPKRGGVDPLKPVIG